MSLPSNHSKEPAAATWVYAAEFVIGMASMTIFPVIYYIFLLKPFAQIYGSYRVAVVTSAVVLTTIGLINVFLNPSLGKALPHRPYFYLFVNFLLSNSMGLMGAGFILGWMAATPH